MKSSPSARTEVAPRPEPRVEGESCPAAALVQALAELAYDLAQARREAASQARKAS